MLISTQMRWISAQGRSMPVRSRARQSKFWHNPTHVLCRNRSCGFQSQAANFGEPSINLADDQPNPAGGRSRDPDLAEFSMMFAESILGDAQVLHAGSCYKGGAFCFPPRVPRAVFRSVKCAPVRCLTLAGRLSVGLDKCG